MDINGDYQVSGGGGGGSISAYNSPQHLERPTHLYTFKIECDIKGTVWHFYKI